MSVNRTLGEILSRNSFGLKVFNGVLSILSEMHPMMLLSSRLSKSAILCDPPSTLISSYSVIARSSCPTDLCILLLCPGGSSPFSFFSPLYPGFMSKVQFEGEDVSEELPEVQGKGLGRVGGSASLSGVRKWTLCPLDGVLTMLGKEYPINTKHS